VTVVGERRNPHQRNTESSAIERYAFGFQFGDLALAFGARSWRKCPIHGKQPGKLFDVLLLRFERVRRDGKIVARRIGVEFVKKVERETSTSPDEQDNERYGPQSSPEHAPLRHHHCENPLSFRDDGRRAPGSGPSVAPERVAA